MHDAHATRERILAAATEEFAQHGVAGARVDRIAANAAANKRAIYDYFGDKSRLFLAVLERVMTELADAVPVDGADLAAYATRLFDYHQTNPNMIRLLMWEALELGTSQVPVEDARAQHYEDKVTALVDANPALDGSGPASLMFFTLALVGWNFAMPQLRRMLLDGRMTQEEVRAAVARAVTALESANEAVGAAGPGATEGRGATTPAG
jgi:AcrR family transcriptional regulator